jgi:hypothetical protein
VCPQQKRLFRSRARQRDKDVRNVLLSEIGFVRDLQAAGVRKCFEQRRDVIAKLPVADPTLLQNVPSKDVEIKLRRNPEMSAVIQDGVNQSRMIENGVTRSVIAQKINQRNLIGLRSRERAHDEVEISRGKPRPTIRPDHRDFILRDGRAYGKSDC